MIHVIIPVFNRLNLTINCINSLKDQRNHKELNIVVVDDNSTDGTSLYIKKNFSNVTILKGTGNLFWGGSIKFGVEHVLKICSHNDWILIVNNDVELRHDTVDMLKNLANSKKRKCIVGALTISLKDKQTIIKSGTIIKSWFFNFTKHIYKGLTLDKLTKKDPIEVDFLTGRCLLHPVELFSIAGNYDSDRFPHYGADDEFSYRVKKFGYLALLDPLSIIYLNDYINKVSPRKFFTKLNFTFFNKKSSSNIVNKFKITIKLVPYYAMITFFTIGILKSLYIFFKK